MRQPAWPWMQLPADTQHPPAPRSTPADSVHLTTRTGKALMLHQPSLTFHSTPQTPPTNPQVPHSPVPSRMRSRGRPTRAPANTQGLTPHVHTWFPATSRPVHIPPPLAGPGPCPRCGAQVPCGQFPVSLGALPIGALALRAPGALGLLPGGGAHGWVRCGRCEGRGIGLLQPFVCSFRARRGGAGR